MTETSLNSFISPGTHILLDLWGVDSTQDIALIEHAMRDAAVTCGATVLNIMLHEFGEGYGITGVAILAESHISIHTWPELGYIALDIFMCGKCDPAEAVPVFEKHFKPTKKAFTIHKRG